MNRRNKKVVFKHDDEKIDVPPREPSVMPEPAPAPSRANSPVPEPPAVSTKKRPPVAKPKTERKANAWVAHVRNISKAEGITYKQAMSKAKESYQR